MRISGHLIKQKLEEISQKLYQIICAPEGKSQIFKFFLHIHCGCMIPKEIEENLKSSAI